MNAVEWQNAHDMMLERGRPLWASLVVRASTALRVIDLIDPSQAKPELARLKRFLEAVMPHQGEAARQILNGSAGVVSLDTALKTELGESASFANKIGDAHAGRLLGMLAAQMDAMSHSGALAEVMKMRARIELARPLQTNAEVARWFSMALVPSGPIVSNTGHTVA